MSSSYARYINVVRDGAGNAVENADLRVYIGNSTQLAQLFDGAGNTVGQPLTTDQDGVIRNGTTGADGLGFRVAGGRYRIEGSAGGTTLVTMPDILIGNAQSYDVSEIMALANQNVFENTTIALSETSNGDFFWVAVNDIVVLYENDSGAAVERASIPRLNDILTRQDISLLSSLTNTGIYGSQSEGLAATTDGDYFWAPDGDDFTLYENESGSATLLATLPRAAAASTSATADSLMRRKSDGRGGEIANPQIGADPVNVQYLNQRLGTGANLGSAALLAEEDITWEVIYDNDSFGVSANDSNTIGLGVTTDWDDILVARASSGNGSVVWNNVLSDIVDASILTFADGFGGQAAQVRNNTGSTDIFHVKIYKYKGV